MTENTNHIDRGHPIRVILDHAAHGRQPSSRDLDQLLDEVSTERLPDGQSLNRFRASLVSKAASIAALNGTGAHGPAVAAAEEAAAEFARQMTTEQRALKTSDSASSQREVEEAVARAFDH
ncbi:hypothetical protein AKG07_08820 [Microbacterium sp. CGR1]|uniref:hypothetical protein n=1 Tax=Microbacterium sp. CGR1 TaxID=1696072 RepID=UPI00069CD4D7|nr:hypothetical protein [Microbacterium sp. CGR1]AKV86387.1 hypothetical protein AKG07_08820 [Microbacterium sp. CGR1]